MSDSESDSDFESKLKRKGKRKGKAKRVERLANGKFKCTTCGNIYKSLASTYKHTRFCIDGRNKSPQPDETDLATYLKCKWCGIQFTNRGNLATHALCIHGDSSYKRKTPTPKQKFNCQACSKFFPTESNLRYHIRQNHFNLKAIVPHIEFTNVNEVWFEKVRRSDKVMEMRRTGNNTVIMRILDDNTRANVKTVTRKIIDVSNLYPAYTHSKTKCQYCDKLLVKRDIKKHIDEIHFNLKKHSCNLCNRSFKRAYQYLQHQCGRKVKVRGFKHSKQQQIRVASIESMGIQ